MKLKYIILHKQLKIFIHIKKTTLNNMGGRWGGFFMIPKEKWWLLMLGVLFKLQTIRLRYMHSCVASFCPKNPRSRH
jgi:hypothetical protein